LEECQGRVPTGPWIGVEMDTAALDEVTVDRVELRR